MAKRCLLSLGHSDHEVIAAAGTAWGPSRNHQRGQSHGHGQTARGACIFPIMTGMIRRLRTSVAPVTLVILTMFLAACGSSASPSTSGDEDPMSSAARDAPSGPRPVELPPFLANAMGEWVARTTDLLDHREGTWDRHPTDAPRKYRLTQAGDVVQATFVESTGAEFSFSAEVAGDVLVLTYEPFGTKCEVRRKSQSRMTSKCLNGVGDQWIDSWTRR